MFMPSQQPPKWKWGIVMPVLLSVLAVIVIPSSVSLYRMGRQVESVDQSLMALKAKYAELKTDGSDVSRRQIATSLLLQAEIEHVKTELNKANVNLERLDDKQEQNRLLLECIKTTLDNMKEP